MGGSKSKPLVLLAGGWSGRKTGREAEEGGGGGSGTFFVLGVECPDEPGEAATSGSFLAKNFEFARRHAKLGSQSTTAMSFDGATMELRRDDAPRFIDSLISVPSQQAKARANMPQPPPPLAPYGADGDDDGAEEAMGDGSGGAEMEEMEAEEAAALQAVEAS